LLLENYYYFYLLQKNQILIAIAIFPYSTNCQFCQDSLLGLSLFPQKLVPRQVTISSANHHI